MGEGVAPLQSWFMQGWRLEAQGLLCLQLSLSSGTNSPRCFRKDGADGKAQILGAKLTQPPKLYSKVQEADTVPGAHQSLSHTPLLRHLSGSQDPDH